jgi:hypothetical protein
MGRMMYRGGQGGMGTIPGGPLGKARFAMANGRYDEAERIVRRRLERYPDDAAAHLLLAQALLQLGQVAEAADEARIVVREQPTNVDGHLMLSAAAMQRGGGPLGRIPPEAERSARRAVQPARTEVDQAIQLEPRLAGAHLMRAIILYSDKDPNGAIQAADSALRFDRTLAQAEFIKANALLDTKRYDEALTSLDTAERQNPMLLAGANGRAMRGRIYFKQRKYKQSYAQFLAAQLMSNRLKRLAPAIAGVNMVFAGLFGQNAQYAWVVLFVVIVLAVLFGISFIPVVGQWIVALVVLALIGVSGFGYLRQVSGRILPAATSAKVTTIVVAVAATLVGAIIVGAIIAAISTNVLHVANWKTPFTLVIAGGVGLLLAAGAVYLWNRATAQYAGGGNGTAAA